MGKTTIDVRGDNFYINGRPVYDEIPDAGAAKGLLFNARFIQGVFDDRVNRRRWDRYGRVFDPDKNTDDLIAALPAWYQHGLRAITVGFQGGMPVFTTDVTTIDNNPFGEDGKTLDSGYASRMDRLIRAADELGMVVIVNILYWAQAERLRDGRAVVSALKTAARFLKEGGYSNVLIDVANEYNIKLWKKHPLVQEPECMQVLIDLVREESGGMMVGSSNAGGVVHPEVIAASDVVLVHGNGMTRGQLYDYFLKIKELAGDRPVLCNEDSPCFSRLEVALQTHVSWGHYDNFTKQEPPADWGITPGQDTFFARRMARAVGIKIEELPLEEQFYLQGLEPHTQWEGKRWIRLAAEYPERVDRVNFYRNGELIYTSYDEPFFLFRETTWIQRPWEVREDDREWAAEVILSDGRVVTKRVQVG